MQTKHLICGSGLCAAAPQHILWQGKHETCLNPIEIYKHISNQIDISILPFFLDNTHFDNTHFDLYELYVWTTAISLQKRGNLLLFEVSINKT